MTPRAQSETLGFVFVFALITLTVGSVYALGMPTLQTAQDAERTANMERAFEVLNDNVDDVVRKGAPSRATEIKLSGGSLSVTGETTITVAANDTGSPGRNATFSMTTRPISYSDGDGTTISYVAGAIVREDDGSAVMLSDPNWLVDDDRTVIPFVVTFPGTDRTSLGGRTTVLVLTEHRSSGLAGEFRTGPGSQAEVNVTVESPNAEAWGRFLEREGMTQVGDGPGDGDVTYRFTADALRVSRISIPTTLSG